MSEITSLPANRDELRAVIAAGGHVKYLFFWGHRPRHDGRIGPGCLSQWWPAPFVADGIRYATAEHYMMVAKARLFGDDAAAERILAAPGPGAAKALGREVRGFDEEVWQARCVNIVVAGNTAKFDQHPDLRAYLVGTAGRVLVEASPRDRIWGIGLAADDPQAVAPSRWPGLNLLGFALMRTRSALLA